MAPCARRVQLNKEKFATLRKKQDTSSLLASDRTDAVDAQDVLSIADAARELKPLIDTIGALDSAAGTDQSSETVTYDKLRGLRELFIEKSSTLRAEMFRSLGEQDLDAEGGPTRVNFKRLDLRKVLDMDVGSIEYCPVEEVVDLVRLFLDYRADDLLARFDGRSAELIRLSQVLISKFANEYFVIRNCLQQAQESMQGVQGTQEYLRQVLQEHSHCKDTMASMEEAARELQDKCEQLQEMARFGPQMGGPQQFQLRSAVTLVQSMWRKKRARDRLHNYLEELVFGGAGPAPKAKKAMRSRNRAVQGAEAAVRSVKAAMQKVNAKLRRSGLSLEAAYRCADVQYKGQQILMPVGQLINFFMDKQRASLMPGEIHSLLRLFMAPGRLNHMNPGSVPASGDSGMLGEGGEAWMWKITYDHIRQLALAFPVEEETPKQGISKPTKAGGDISATCLSELRDALAISAEMRNPRRLTPSWKVLLQEARAAYIQEEFERLTAELSSLEDDPDKRAELEDQLKFYQSQLNSSEIGTDTQVPATVLLARLLKERVPVLPVTIHAAVRAAAAWTHHRRMGKEILHGKEEKYIKFDSPLPSSPSLLHVSCEGLPGSPEPPWSISLLSSNERGFVLDVESIDPTIGWPEDLRIKYAAGSASGEVVVVPRSRSGASPRSKLRRKKQVEVTFPGSLLGPPSLVRVQTYINPGEDKVGHFLVRIGWRTAAQVGHMSAAEKRATVISELSSAGKFTEETLTAMSTDELGKVCSEMESLARIPQRHWWQLPPYTVDVGPTSEGFVMRVNRLPGSAGLQDPQGSKTEDAGDITFSTEIGAGNSLKITAAWKTEKPHPEDKDVLALAAGPLPGSEKPSIQVSRPSAVGFAVSIRDKELPDDRHGKADASGPALTTVKYEVHWAERTVSYGRLNELAEFPASLEPLPALPSPEPTVPSVHQAIPAGVPTGPASDTALVRRCNDRARFWMQKRQAMAGQK